MAALKYWNGSSWQTLGNPIGVMNADVSFGGYKATNLGTPTTAGDAATKAYVDAGDVSKLLDIQKILGANAAYKAITSGQRFTTNAAGTIDLALNYTPPVNAWWEVLLFVGTMNKTDANYHYAQPQLGITPNDVDGQNTQTLTKTQHSAVQQYEPYNMNALWKLAAGTPYQAFASVGFSGGTWQYNQAPNMLMMVGKAWAR